MTTHQSSFRRNFQRVALATTFVAAVASTAAAAAGPDLLTKAEVDALAVGKKLQYVRASDGATIAFDVRGNGRVYYTKQRTSRSITIAGNYTIEDDGKLCFKWEVDRYVSMQDGCFLFRRTADKIQVVGGANPDRIVGDLVQ